MSYEYVENFKKLTFGMFNHFGLYSILGKGEWAERNLNIDKLYYEGLTDKFRVKEDWAKKLVKTAKASGCRYITLTTRHHDGFSLYDTQGLSRFDAPHSASGRDLVAEFVSECNAAGVVPFFYHTLLDWHNEDYKNDFKAYIDYLVKSVETLSKNYGKIGGFWFDGMWDKWDANWQEERLYATIRKYQPEAMIINNTGLSKNGELGNIELDSVTFERGKPFKVNSPARPVAGEVCDSLNDHWGFAKNDISLKTPDYIISTLIDCKKNGCNYLLNTGLKGNGYIPEADKFVFESVGKWIKANKNFIYDVKKADYDAENADLFTDGDYLYAVIKDTAILADADVIRESTGKLVKLDGVKIDKAVWLDTNKPVKLNDDRSFDVEPFSYGTNLYARVAKIKLK